MLPLLRHLAKPIMIAVAAIVIVAFIFFTGNTRDDYAEGPAVVLLAHGKEYLLTDVERIQRTYRIARDLQLPGSGFGGYAGDIISVKYSFGDQRTQQALMLSGAPVDYAPNVLVLREAMKKHGVVASDAEVQQVFRNSAVFQANGQFDRDTAEKYEKGLTSYGLKLQDVYDVIRDSIGLRKLQTVVAGNLAVSPKVASEYYGYGAQTIKAASIPFLLEDFKKAATVTDEEIAKYYEENKENYKTREKRAISHVLIPKPNTEGKNAEDTTKIEKAHYAMLLELATKLTEPKVDFAAAVKAKGYEVKAIPAFSMDAPPEALKEEYGLLQAIFSANPESGEISDPIEVKDGDFIFKITSVVKPAQQELKDVKDKVRDTLAGNKAKEAMQAAANDAKKKLEDAMNAGKKFDDAAKEAKLTPQVLPEFSPTTPNPEMKNGYEIAYAAMEVPPGGFAKPIPTEEGVILVHVISKELRKSPESATRKKSVADSLENGLESDLFRSWFERRYEEAGIRNDRLLEIALSDR